MYENVYFLGTGRVASQCIEILASTNAKEHMQCLAVEREAISSTKAICNRHQIPYRFFQPSELDDYLRSLPVKSLLISAHNQHIFPKKVVDNPYLTIINFHNAFLPFYRGRNAPTWEIFHQESFGGATWHEVDANVDTGGIIIQKKVPIEEDEIALSLLMKCAQTGIQLFREHVDEFLSEKYELYYPKEPGMLYLSQKLPNGGYLDTEWDFDKAYAFLRSMDYKMLDVVPRPKLKRGEYIFEISDYMITQFEKRHGTNETLFFVDSPKDGRCLCCQLERIEV